MIVDSHAHAFPPMGGSSGHVSAQEHMQYIQHLLASHHQPVRRVADHAIFTEQTLFDGVDFSLNGLTEVNYRSAGFGRFTWTVDETDYYLQYLPPSSAVMSASPELMIAQMDYVGVDKAVLQTGHAYGRLNNYLADAVQRHSNRFWALAMIDEWLADQQSQQTILLRAINDQQLHGLWFQSSNLRQNNRTESLDDPIFHPFWDCVRELGIPVFWFVTSPIPGREAYMQELEAFGKWTQRYPEIPVMFTHGLPLHRFMSEGVISIPNEAWNILDSPNVMIEILIPIFQGAIWEYPFVEAQPVIREYYERFGPDKLAWGSDMPNVERHCTYRQSIDYLRLHCDFIPSYDMSKICGDNVSRLLESNRV